MKNKKKEIEEIICEVLMNYGFDDDYIKYSSYKYKLFFDFLSDTNNDYNDILEYINTFYNNKNTNIYFDKKEKEAIFKILALCKYDIKSYENYYFHKTK